MKWYQQHYNKRKKLFSIVFIILLFGIFSEVYHQVEVKNQRKSLCDMKNQKLRALSSIMKIKVMYLFI